MEDVGEKKLNMFISTGLYLPEIQRRGWVVYVVEIPTPVLARSHKQTHDDQ